MILDVNRARIIFIPDDWKEELSHTFKNNKSDNSIRCRGCDKLLGGYIGKSIIIFDESIDEDNYSVCRPCSRNEKIDEVLDGKRTHT